MTLGDMIFGRDQTIYNWSNASNSQYQHSNKIIHSSLKRPVNNRLEFMFFYFFKLNTNF